ncbi:MAG: crossover junction endodeoxyribonuclease RuvC [Bacillota bacterium]|nr:crossover junction endodeoxyribonuclease RuvC [Bacillota bacterium]
MIIMGLDPGTAITGYGVIEAAAGKYRALSYGCLRTDSKLAMPQRLLSLYQQLAALIQEHQPEQIAVEQLFFNKNITTAVPVGQARGVLLLCAAQQGIALAEYTPLEVKQALTGYGRADKQQIQYMISRLLNIETPKPDDAADALAIAITHAHYYQGKKLRGEVE